ncbi:MAG: squalene/phytoene synthase family protein [Emcibacteraceae bacterium]|nr:squalene/phytoene synthase family protein [Emcibacteraceae bacterium]
MSNLETYCADQVKKYDYNRFLVTLFAPADVREDLFALFSFNHEVAKIREAVSEPMLGEIRLQWWREAIEGIVENKPRNHEVVLPLGTAFHKHGLKADMFLKVIEARTADLYDENPKTLADFENYLGATSGNLTKIAAYICGERDEHVLSLAYDLGLVWGLIGTVRAVRYHISLRKLSFPQDLMDEYGVTKRNIMAMDEGENIKNLVQGLCISAEKYLDQIAADKKLINKKTRPIFLLMALSRSYLNMIKKADYDPFKIDEKAGMFPRQFRLFFSALFGLM